MNDEPLAYFLTWTVYGTHFLGDPRGWRKGGMGELAPQPLLANWRAERLKHAVLLLDNAERNAVENEVQRLSAYRGWKCWAVAARTNHIHTVTTAPATSGAKVRDQFKANCTRVLRERSPQFADRPVWSVGGDWVCINREDDLETVILYVSEAQDNMHRDQDRR